MLPLCVDLDETLIRTDSLHEQLVRLASRSPLRLLAVPLWLLKGRAYLKQRLSAEVQLDPALLPYREDFVEFLQREKSRGRRLILVTAAHETVAHAVAQRMQLFDQVVATEDGANLKGTSKAKTLAGLLGVSGSFAYAGNSRTDLAVWREAGAAVLVNTTDSVAHRVKELEIPIEARFDERHTRLRSLIKLMRIYQWTKNILVFVTLLLAHDFSRANLTAASIMFAAFCATASGIYVINDLFDLDADRAHSRKRMRPFASGRLPLSYGLLGPLFVVTGLGMALLVNQQAFTALVAYVVLTSAYSIRLKTLPLVDVFVLAMLYTIRLYSGGAATGVAVSMWLLAFSSFLFLSLALLKRFAELSDMKDHQPATNSRRGYVREDLQIILAMGVASAFAASLVLSLYVDSDMAGEYYATPRVLWLIVPLFLFWQCRMWLSSARGQMTDDPIVFAIKDWVSWIVVTIASLIFVLASVAELSFLNPGS